MLEVGVRQVGPEMNFNKTKVMYLEQKNNFFLDNHEVERCHEYIYLGQRSSRQRIKQDSGT